MDIFVVLLLAQTLNSGVLSNGAALGSSSWVGGTIVVEGDSIPANTGELSNTVTADRYGDQLVSALLGSSGHSYAYFNVARGGTCVGLTCSLLPSMLSVAAANVDAHFNATSGWKNVAILNGGYNDYYNSQTVAQIKADIHTWLCTRKNVGFKVVVVTPTSGPNFNGVSPPGTSASQGQADRQAIRDDLVTPRTCTDVNGAWAFNVPDAVADLFSDTEVGCQTCYTIGTDGSNPSAHCQFLAGPHPTGPTGKAAQGGCGGISTDNGYQRFASTSPFSLKSALSTIGIN